MAVGRIICLQADKTPLPLPSSLPCPRVSRAPCSLSCTFPQRSEAISTGSHVFHLRRAQRPDARAKKARLGPLTPIPLPLKRSEVLSSVDRTFALSRENRKPPLSFNKFRTPSPPIASKPELRNSVSASGGRTEGRKSRPGGLFSVGRSFSGMNVLKEISMVSVSGIKEEGRERRGQSKGSLRKSVTSFERWKLMKAMG